jgi:hypothetical protein
LKLRHPLGWPRIPMRFDEGSKVFLGCSVGFCRRGFLSGCRKQNEASALN